MLYAQLLFSVLSLHFILLRPYRRMPFFPYICGLFSHAKFLPVTAALFLFISLKFSQMEHIQTLGSFRHLNSWDSVISELEAEYLYSSCQQESRGLITSISSSLNSQFHLGENILVSVICASIEDKVKKTHVIFAFQHFRTFVMGLLNSFCITVIMPLIHLRNSFVMKHRFKYRMEFSFRQH